MQTIILLPLKISQYFLKCNTFTHDQLPRGEKDHTEFYY